MLVTREKPKKLQEKKATHLRTSIALIRYLSMMFGKLTKHQKEDKFKLLTFFFYMIIENFYKTELLVDLLGETFCELSEVPYI